MNHSNYIIPMLIILRKLLIIFIGFTVLVSCDEDFPVNGDWEDITTVYGLLNSADTAQYIKINKAFLGEGDIYEMAQIADCVQYKNTLNVKLIEYEIADENLTPYHPDNWKRTNRDEILLYRTNEIVKDTGVFSNDLNYLYKTTEKIYKGYKYVLEIVNPEYGVKVWSETYMIYKFVLNVPRNIPTLKINMANETNVFSTEWETAVYGKVYQPSIRFHYLEVLNDDTTKHSIDLFYQEQNAKEVREPKDASMDMRQKVGGTEFYYKIANSITEDPDIIRIPLTLDFIYYMGGQSFSTYLNVSKSSENFGQEETSYTNVKNGKGIFDCRTLYSLIGKEMNNVSLDSLHRGRFTKHLNFLNYTVVYP